MLARVLAAAVLAAAVLAGSSTLGGLSAGAARAAEPLIEVPPAQPLAFSPNGDGHKDTLPVRFRLAERAHVHVWIPRVGTVDLGTRGPGLHLWRWDGRGARDGFYRLAIRARTPDGRSGRDTRFAEISRGAELDDVRIFTTRTTVYPTTPGKQDRIYVRSTKAGNPTAVVVRDAAGRVVTEDRFSQWWLWDGAGQPAGDYVATFSVRDRFGNHRDLRRTLHVSADHLVQETWSTTVAAADVRLFPMCGTSPSPRFDHGLTVAPRRTCRLAFLMPKFRIPVPIDPDVTWRFTVTGGPTVSGAGDTATVYVADDVGVIATRTAVGDATTTTPWGGPHRWEWDPQRKPEPTGSVMVDDPGASYDVAEVSLEVRYWTPGPTAAERG